MALRPNEWMSNRLGNCTEFEYKDSAGDTAKIDVWPDGEWLVSIKLGGDDRLVTVTLSEPFLREVLAEYGRWVGGQLPG